MKSFVPTMQLVGVLAATFVLGVSSSKADPAHGRALENEILVQIFDRSVREASTSVLLLTNTKILETAFLEDAQRKAQTLYLQATRYRHTYGRRGWQTAGPIVESVFNSLIAHLELLQAPEATKAVVRNYLDKLNKSPEVGR